jgi:hypothetical protein
MLGVAGTTPDSWDNSPAVYSATTTLLTILSKPPYITALHTKQRPNPQHQLSCQLNFGTIELVSVER